MKNLPWKAEMATNPPAISTSWKLGFARHQGLIKALCFLKHTLRFSGCHFHAVQHKEATSLKRNIIGDLIKPDATIDK